jgi:hypothetical protein
MTNETLHGTAILAVRHGGQLALDKIAGRVGSHGPDLSPFIL